MADIQTSVSGGVISPLQSATTITEQQRQSVGEVGQAASASSASHLCSLLIVDWELLVDAGGDGYSIGLNPDRPRDGIGSEVIEFSWGIYDCASGEVAERERRYVKPNAKLDFSTAAVQNLFANAQIDATEFEESAVPLQDVVAEFNAVVTNRRAAAPSFSQVAVAVFSSEKRNRFFADATQKGIDTTVLQVGFSEIFDLRRVLAHFYPQLTNEQLKHPHLLAQRLLAQAFDCLSGLDLCVALGSVLKRMTHDGFPLTTDLLSQHDIADELSLLDVSDECKKEGDDAMDGRGNTNDSSGGNQTSQSANYVLRLRGLPWDVSTGDVVDFFKPIVPEIKTSEVHLVQDYEGNATGEAYVEIQTLAIRDKCLRELHGKNIGRRWIEIFRSTDEELRRYLSTFRAALAFGGRGDPAEREKLGVLRLRGLPWSSNEHEIAKFFSENGHQVEVNSIVLGTTRDNRMSGEAWAVLPTVQAADEARKATHKKLIGRRYIEVFPSTFREVDNARRGLVMASRHDRYGGPYQMGGGGGGGRMHMGVGFGHPMGGPMGMDHHMGGGGGRMMGGDMGHGGGSWGRASYGEQRSHGGSGMGENVNIRRLRERDFEFGFSVVRLRGLPFNSTENHIMDFFQGFGMSAILPATVPIDGRPSGEAYVEFINPEEAWRAARSRNGAKMDHRYIELFPSTKQEMELAAAGLDPREIRQRVSSSSSSSRGGGGSGTAF